MKVEGKVVRQRKSCGSSVKLEKGERNESRIPVRRCRRRRMNETIRIPFTYSSVSESLHGAVFFDGTTHLITTYPSTLNLLFPRWNATMTKPIETDVANGDIASPDLTIKTNQSAQDSAEDSLASQVLESNQEAPDPLPKSETSGE
jgi:hypothetical protein